MEGKNFDIIQNTLNLDPKKGSQNHIDGLDLSQEEKEYLLPHFLMLLVGKPGSGKTTLMKELITNKQMYKGKFDRILMVSPSFGKTQLEIPSEDCIEYFSLEWIFKKFGEINEKQNERVFGHKRGGQNVPLDLKLKLGYKTKTVGKSAVLNDEKSRFFASDILRHFGAVDTRATGAIYATDTEQAKIKQLMDLPYEFRKKTHANILLVLDDVVGDIKKNENNPALAKLVMNRRHLIFNGTISIIMVTQKYTLIPVRVRSNANWLVLFQLNPIDFENVYQDAVIHSLKTWRSLLSFIFQLDLFDDYKSSKDQKKEKKQKKQEEEKKDFFVDVVESTKNHWKYSNDKNQQTDNQQNQQNQKSIEEIKKKKYDNIGIWVEFNIYFKNFQRLDF